MCSNIKWSFCKKIDIVLVAAMLCLLAFPLIGVAVLLVTSNLHPLGSQPDGSYYVERINASTNTCESEDYIHLWEFDTKIGGGVYRYSVTDRTKEDLTGKEYIWDAAVKEELLYYEDKDGYWCVDLSTRDQWQLSDEDTSSVEKILSSISYDKTCEKIEEILDQLDYHYTDVALSHLDQSDEKIIGITQVPLNVRYRGGRLAQKGLRYDILFSYDPATESCEILYQPKNNRTRIIGYQDGLVYLFRENEIYRQRLNSDKKEELASLPESDSYTFDWWKDYLLVFDHEKNELVEVLEI